MRVRFLSYNIMTGGEGRADPIAEVILGRSADVVGLHEATDLAVLRRIARRLEMDFVAAACAGGRTALLSRHRILDSANVGLVHASAMPVLDATLDVAGREVAVRVAHVADRAEATRMFGLLGTRRMPDVMLMSYEPPLGFKVADEEVLPADTPSPDSLAKPVRQADEVLVAPRWAIVEQWSERDRLALYASDHLPAGAEVDFAEPLAESRA